MYTLKALTFAGILLSTTVPTLAQAKEIVIVDGSFEVDYKSLAGDDLAMDFAQKIPVEYGQNMLISPQNCWHALSLVTLGAEGTTREELNEIVNPNGLCQDAFVEYINYDSACLYPACISSSSFFVSPKVQIRPQYQALLEKSGLEKIRTLNFLNKDDAMQQINSWVQGATKGKIKELVTASDIDQDTVAMLVAALYFKASWQKPFSKDATNTEPFYTVSADAIQVPMMHQVDRFAYASQDGFEYVSLGYNSKGASQWQMELILPPQCGTEEAIEGLSSALPDLRKACRKTRLDLSVPRFKASMRWDVRDTMEQMGITLPFTDFADFSLISEQPLKIQKIFQECFIDVTEEGTEGAAATAIGFALTAIRDTNDPIPVSFNRPFYFIVRERISGAILFFGLIENPLG